MCEEVENYARWCSSGYYGSEAIRLLEEMEGNLISRSTLTNNDQISYEELEEIQPQLHDLDEKIYSSCISTVIFAAMAVEAYIYDYSARKLGDAFTDNHVESLSVVNKWVVVVQLINNRAFPKDGPAYNFLKRLIKSRNALVHSKSEPIEPKDLTSEALTERQESMYRSARDSVRALHELSKVITALDDKEIPSIGLGIKLHG